MNRLPESSEVESLVRDAAQMIRGVLPPGSRLIWFGSWVTGRPTERSDIDLGVDLGRELTAKERVAVSAVIDELETLRKVDVVDLHAVSDERRAQILAEGVEL